jgi:hypothetical protein
LKGFLLRILVDENAETVAMVAKANRFREFSEAAACVSIPSYMTMDSPIL